MKHIILFTCLFSVFVNSSVLAQSITPVSTASTNVGISGLTLAMSIQQFKEKLEFDATEYVLRNNKEVDLFTLKVMNLDNVKVSDLSNISCIAFNVNMLNKDLTVKERYVLLLLTNRGWISDNGINTGLNKYKLLSRTEWNNIFLTYINCASSFKTKYSATHYIQGLTLLANSMYNENDSSHLKITNSNHTISFFKIDNYPIGRATLTTGGVVFTVPNSPRIPFMPFHKDAYSVVDFSPEYKIIYSENALGLYIKQMDRLVELKRNTINAIHFAVNN
ncbi:MAG: hypothetical protein WC760_08120 [Bacteroidia bacterium]|jgi:hypothetical protein